MTSVKTFKVSPKNLSRLSKNEQKMLPYLLEAAKLINAVYLKQENNLNNGANFYPRDAIKNEITEAAQKNPKIFSPFTIVIRDKSEKLTAIDYHKAYREDLEKVASVIKKASAICINKSFKKYLSILASALITGNYQQADKAWLETKGNNLDIVIGPHERYLDKLFFIKRAYQADVSIFDEEESNKATIFRNILYSTVGPNAHRVQSSKQTDIKVKDSLMFAGFLGRALFTQQHLPADTDTVERYGSRILGYESALNYKFEKLIYPIFCSLFEKTFRERYSKSLIKRGAFFHVLLNGIVQHLHRYRGSRTRLRDLFPIIDEANTAASGIQHAKHLLLKGAIDQKELEATMIARICWIFSELVISRKTNTRDVYLKGDAIIFNFLRKEGALLEKDGLSWPNFAKMFFELENLSTIFAGLLEEGSYPETREFIDKYYSIEELKRFEKRLLNINPI